MTSVGGSGNSSARAAQEAERARQAQHSAAAQNARQADTSPTASGDAATAQPVLPASAKGGKLGELLTGEDKSLQAASASGGEGKVHKGTKRKDPEQFAQQQKQAKARQAGKKGIEQSAAGKAEAPAAKAQPWESGSAQYWQGRLEGMRETLNNLGSGAPGMREARQALVEMNRTLEASKGEALAPESVKKLKELETTFDRGVLQAEGKLGASHPEFLEPGYAPLVPPKTPSDPKEIDKLFGDIRNGPNKAQRMHEVMAAVAKDPNLDAKAKAQYMTEASKYVQELREQARGKRSGMTDVLETTAKGIAAEVGKTLESDPVGIMGELSKRYQGGRTAGGAPPDTKSFDRVMRTLLDPPTNGTTRSVQTAMVTALADIRQKSAMGSSEAARDTASIFGELMGGMDNALREAKLDKNAQTDFVVQMFSGTASLAGKPFGPVGAGLAGAASQVAETVGDWAKDKNQVGSDQIMAAMYAIANSVDIGKGPQDAMRDSWDIVAVRENGVSAPVRAANLSASPDSLAYRLAQKGFTTLSELGQSYAQQGVNAVLSGE
jgi:hypothetical protein